MQADGRGQAEGPIGPFDLAIDGGTIVSPEGRRAANLYVADERIVLISDARHDAMKRVDASGLLVMPGMVDAHVHLMEPGQPEREDFPTGTAAAVRAGVTTIVEHTHGSPVRDVGDFEAKAARLSARSRADFALAAHAWPGHEADVEPLWRSGVAFFKVFTCTTHGVPGLDAGQLLGLFGELARLGSIALVHCEDESLTSRSEEALRATGRDDGGVIPVWRNREAELVAVGTVALLARLTGARVVVAHASHSTVVDLVDRERSQGASVACETCPQYLTLYESEVIEHRALRKFTPPARARSPADLDEMWAALRDRRIAYVSSDHAPSTARQKLDKPLWDAPFGLPGIDTTLPTLLDAAHSGKISYELITDVYARTPAHLFGLAPHKGSLDVGADADVVLVDPNEEWRVADADIVSKAGWSPYAGRTLRGRAVATFLRGQLVAERGAVLGTRGAGRMVLGAGSADRG